MFVVRAQHIYQIKQGSPQKKVKELQGKISIGSTKLAKLSDDEKLVYLICKLIDRLYRDGHNKDRKELIVDIWEIMYSGPVQQKVLVTNNLLLKNAQVSDIKKQKLLDALEPALKNPRICIKARGNPNVCLGRVEGFFALIIDYICKLCGMSNTSNISEIKSIISPPKPKKI